ncbi:MULTISPECIES: ABC-three component system middle component 6 [unclassified Streptomyces]|uniref:ABC-three component system middle component 6 n=1 Tax=unclassified Streptomyces TaxID=2593676 RepID=UPI000CD567AE|nr:MULTISPECIES: ABC-three component system middle component 6 [unclassified Streptomyces]
MITPTKGIAADRCLLAVGAQILLQLDEPRSVSQAWSRLRTWRSDHGHHSPVSFGWFVLALDMLFSLGTIDLHRDLLVVRSAHAATSERR